MSFRPNRRTLVLALLGTTIAPLLVWWILFVTGIAPAPGQLQVPPFNLSDRLDTLDIQSSPDGSMVTFQRNDETLTMTAEEFLAEVDRRQNNKTRMDGLFRFLDITRWTGIGWCILGFGGQALFAGRMIVQWWASEKLKTPVIPTSFWWMSLIGSSMIIVYFIWRREAVGVIGQATGWLVYVRSLWFIYGKSEQ